MCGRKRNCNELSQELKHIAWVPLRTTAGKQTTLMAGTLGTSLCPERNDIERFCLGAVNKMEVWPSAGNVQAGQQTAPRC